MRINTVIKTADVGLQDVAPPQSSVLREFMTCALRPLAINRAPGCFEVRCRCCQAGSRDTRSYKSPILDHLLAKKEVVDRIADAERAPEQASPSEGVDTSQPTRNAF